MRINHPVRKRTTTKTSSLASYALLPPNAHSHHRLAHLLKRVYLQTYVSDLDHIHSKKQCSPPSC
ncbi:hypothetical protein CCACVL1_29862 [Corchorus capsularis]|uniref:Uncharacterized protein n=1 Tax=Corchorus capsularis TaxID=210143 RepID=A0A1R3FZQ6_COCAP|nr:hypothetical protein CCACVL1_29862 [Corchorus capsularis]